MFLLRILSKITLEPVIILHIFGKMTIGGGGLQENLLFTKVCRYELNYTAEVCDDLGNETNSEANIDVQHYVNDFQVLYPVKCRMTERQVYVHCVVHSPLCCVPYCAVSVL